MLIKSSLGTLSFMSRVRSQLWRAGTVPILSVMYLMKGYIQQESAFTARAVATVELKGMSYQELMLKFHNEINYGD